MTATSSLTAADLAPGRSVVFRNATVLTLDDGHDVLDGADVLVSGERIAAVGPNLAVPEGTAEIDAAGGILMPGMIDTHRHMWQTAMRGYGADWTLTQYFVWYYLQWGKTFRPQDIYAGNLLAAIEAIDAGVWGATSDDGIRLMHEGGFMTPSTIYVHAATLTRDSYNRIAATGGSASVSTESEQSAGQGYPPTWQLRKHNIPVSLSMDTSVWWSGDLFSAMRATLGADRSREHLEAHAKQETVTNCHMRAEDVVDFATRGGSRALGLDSVTGSIEPGKKADLVLIKNDTSPVMFPLLNPYGHVAFQAQRGDVHTVVINGRVVKYDHRLVGIDLASARQVIEQTVQYLKGQLGPAAWTEGMHPEIPQTKVLDNPYTYTEWDAGSAQWKGTADSDPSA
jgi:cytosine/adenosine deaminase-related metal-dependent hydrolase